MDDLVAFLRARLDADEERAEFVRLQLAGSNWPELEPWALSWHDEYDLLCIEPSRALAEVQAKRAILLVCEYWLSHPEAGVNVQLGYVMRQLATPYADHPDYRQEWRP